jgi:hypothetical protein
MAEPRPDLPPILSAIADAAGLEAALKIAQAHGGTRVTVPTLADGDNWLTALVDAEVAAAVIDALGAAQRVDIPLDPNGPFARSRRQRNQAYAELEASNASEKIIARSLGITQRAVRLRRAKSRRGRDERQGNLF